MVYVFIILDWILVQWWIQLKWFHCGRVSERELPIVIRSHKLPVVVLWLELTSFIGICNRIYANAVSDLYGYEWFSKIPTYHKECKFLITQTLLRFLIYFIIQLRNLRMARVYLHCNANLKWTINWPPLSQSSMKYFFHWVIKEVHLLSAVLLH